MHCAFALMIGATGVRVCRHWCAKAFWAVWPLLIAWVVIVTGNHYWVDVALGWMVAVTAALVAQPAARPRPARGLVLPRRPAAGGRGLDTTLPPMIHGDGNSVLGGCSPRATQAPGATAARRAPS